MRSAIAIAFAVGVVAVPYKRDIVTDYDVVYETDVVTVFATANAEPTTTSSSSSVAVAPVESSSSSSTPFHYGHNHYTFTYGHYTPSSEASSSSYVAPTSSSTEAPPAPTTSAYVAPTTSSTSTSSSTYIPPPAPTTSSTTSVWVAPTPSSTYVAPTTSSSSAWVAPTTSVSSQSAKPTAYSEIVVLHHNLHRANHSAPALTWSDDLAKSAQDIAASCVYAHNTEVDGGGYGQNIAAGVEGNNISTIITDLFYNGEVGWYDGLYGQAQPDMTNFEHWGHFSQIVWKDTTQVGCATQYCPNGLGNVGSDVSPYFTVCNYKNPGNYANEYGANVGASLKQPTIGWNAGL